MARKKRQTRTEYLNDILKSLLRPEHGAVEVEYRPFAGWYAAGEARYFNDEGDYLGADWKEAELTLKINYAYWER